MKITNVMAVSLDGRIASQPGERDSARRALGFTNDDDRAHIEALVRSADAVIVGSSSVQASAGVFEVVNDRGVSPVWVVPTRAGLAADARFYRQTIVSRWLVSPAALGNVPSSAGVRQLVYGGEPMGRFIVRELAAAGHSRVILFGGSEINRHFYQEGLVDEVILTVCPLILGAENAVPLVSPPLTLPVSLALVASQPKGNLVFLTYTVQKH